MSNISKRVMILLVFILIISTLVQLIVIQKITRPEKITGRATSQGQLFMCIDGVLNISNPLSDRTLFIGENLSYDVNLSRSSCFRTYFTDSASLFDIDTTTGTFNFTALSIGTYPVTIWAIKDDSIDGTTIVSNTFNIIILSGYSNLSLNYNKFSSNKLVRIYGTDFSQQKNISISIINESAAVIYGPVNASTNSTGSFNATWNTSTYPTGNYTIIAQNLNNSNLDKNKTFQIEAPYSWTGSIMNSQNIPVTSIVEIFYDDGSLFANATENYSVSLDYGQKFNVVITPQSLTTVSNLFIKGLGNTGNLTTLISIADVQLNHSNFTSFNTIFAFNPGTTSFEYINITLKHSAANNETDKVYKCLGWNFTTLSCNDSSSWINIKNITSLATESRVSLAPTDPGLGVGPDPTIYCGNGIKDYNEQCDSFDDTACRGLCLSSCKCGSGTTTITTTTTTTGAGGAGGGSIVTVTEEKCKRTFVEPFTGSVTEIQLHLLDEYCGAIAIWMSKPSAKLTLPKNATLFNEFKINFDYEKAKVLNAVIRFKVPKSWLKENKIKKENIRLFDLSSGSFNHLSTIIEKEEDNYLYFIGIVKNFDHIVILGAASMAELMLQLPFLEMPLDIKPIQVLMVIAIVLLVLTALNFYFILRKKKKPVLKEKSI